MSNDLKTPQDLIFDFIYVMAMRDATLQKAYEGEKAWLTKRTDYNEWTAELKAFVDSVLNNKITNQKDYDTKFISLANTICDKINSAAKGKDICEAFTFGNAQKLINMTMKYYYILVYYNTDLREKFKFCHCPMDRQLLEKVWKERNVLPEIELGLKKDFVVSWSNLHFDNTTGPKCLPKEYIIFQTAVKELADIKICFPIEYDYYAWNNSTNESKPKE